jgi:hypothetical protein
MKTTYLAPRLVFGFVLTILQTQTFLLTNAQAAGLSEPQPQSDSKNAQPELRGDIRKLTDKLAADVADVRRRVRKSSNAPYSDQDRKTFTIWVVMVTGSKGRVLEQNLQNCFMRCWNSASSAALAD